MLDTIEKRVEVRLGAVGFCRSMDCSWGELLGEIIVADELGSIWRGESSDCYNSFRSALAFGIWILDFNFVDIVCKKRTRVRKLPPSPLIGEARILVTEKLQRK